MVTVNYNSNFKGGRSWKFKRNDTCVLLILFFLDKFYGTSFNAMHAVAILSLFTYYILSVIHVYMIH